MKIKKLLKFYFKNPILIPYSLAYKFYHLIHKDHPWISPKAINFCEKILNNKMEAFEWGSGRSTIWFSKRLKSIHSIEQSRDWKKIVNESLIDQSITNAFCELQEIDSSFDKNPQLSGYVNSIDKFPDNHFDFIVVDGHYRQDCLLKAHKKLKSGGYLLLDNSNWMPFHMWNIPAEWNIVHKSSNKVTETTIWMKP